MKGPAFFLIFGAFIIFSIGSCDSTNPCDGPGFGGPYYAQRVSILFVDGNNMQILDNIVPVDNYKLYRREYECAPDGQACWVEHPFHYEGNGIISFALADLVNLRSYPLFSNFILHEIALPGFTEPVTEPMYPYYTLREHECGHRTFKDFYVVYGLDDQYGDRDFNVLTLQFPPY